MDAVRAPSGTVGGQPGSLLSDEDVLACLLREEAVNKDVQEKLASLASALSSASNPGVIQVVRHRFDERTEARAGVAKATEVAKAERESRAQEGQAHKDVEAALRREVEHLEETLRAAEESRGNTEREAGDAASTAETEIIRLREKADTLAKDSGEWQRKTEARESRLEAMQAEVEALHEAMAGIHGEMGAVQRELDGARVSQDKLTKDLSRAEEKTRKTEEALSTMVVRAKEAEKRLRKETSERERVSADLAKVSKKMEEERVLLTTEAKRLRESEAAYRGSSDKLNATNRDLNALLQRLSADLEEARAAAEAVSRRANASATEARTKQEEVRRLGEALTATEARLVAADREKGLVQEALSKASADGQASIAQVDRQRGELELLEREKHDLVLDVQERVRALKEAIIDAERHRERVEEAEKKLKDETSAKLVAESGEKNAMGELTESRRATAVRDERIEALRSELSTLRRTLEQTSDTAKDRDMECAQRLVQLSQANARLSSEGATARARLVETEEAAETNGHKFEDASKALTKSEEAGRRAVESIQRLEEELEVAEAKWTAAQGQIAAADRREKRSAEEARQQLKEALESKNKEAESALREAEANQQGKTASAQRRSMEAEASQRAAERTYERSMATLREEAKKRMAEEEERRVREVADARRKSKAVVGAFQALQSELSNSEAKGSGLERQVSQLSARMSRVGSNAAGAGGGGGTGRSSGGASEGGTSGTSGKDSARGLEATEVEISSLRRQVKAATQAKQTAEKGAAEARSRAEDEAKRRSSLEDLLCRKEEEVLAALGRMDALKQRLQEVEERGTEAQEESQSLIRQRESEIDGLARRNQVLSDAFSRLTSDAADPDAATTNLTVAAQATGREALEMLARPSSTLSLPSAGVREGREERTTRGVRGGGGGGGGGGGYGDATGGRGFPAIPKLGSRGQELGISLGDSWQSTAASSLSPVGTGGPTASATFLETEASLSVLADSSVGFEPPAPPVIDPRHQTEMQGQRRPHGNQSSSSVDEDGGGFKSAPAPGRASVTETRLGGARKSTRDYGDSDSGLGRNRRTGDGDCGGIDSRVPGDRLNGGTVVAENANLAGWSSTDVVGMGGGKGRGEGMLHGVSAAMASGALPSAQFNDTVTLQNIHSGGGNDRNSSGQQHKGVFIDDRDSDAYRVYHRGHGGKDDGDAARRRVDDGRHDDDDTPDGGGDVGSNNNNRRRARRDFERGNSYNERVSSGINQGEAGSSTSGRGADDVGELSRRHVDQALRERAHRRRHSDSIAVPPDSREASLRSRPVNGNTDSAAASSSSADVAFPARLRAEMGLIYAPPPKGRSGDRDGLFRAGAAMLGGGGAEEARFINLDGLAQRARRGAAGSKQDLPGRGGGRITRSRSAATGTGNILAAATTAKQGAAARVYGQPQNSR